MGGRWLGRSRRKGGDREALLAFFNFPAEHWDHLRTTNPIESVFATVRHRTVRTKGSLSSTTARLMVFKLVIAASKTWRRLKGTNHLPKIVAGVRFKDGIEVLEAPTNRRLIAPHHLNSCIALNQLAKPSCVAARSHGVNLGHAYNIRFCSQHWPITFGAQYGS